jgi:hypothetical protein
MDQTERVFLLPSAELLGVLAENGYDFWELVEKFAPDFSTEEANDPTAIGERSPTRVILASAVLVAALTPAVKEAVHAATGRPAIVQEVHLEPMTTPDGRVVFGKGGEPVYRWSTTPKDLNPSPPVHFEGLGIKIDIGKQ